MPKKNPILRYSKRFEKELRKAPFNIIVAFKKRRRLFLINPSHPQLHNHKLAGKYSGFQSINVTGDWRAIFAVSHENRKTIIKFETIGTHSQLYKK